MAGGTQDTLKVFGLTMRAFHLYLVLSTYHKDLKHFIALQTAEFIYRHDIYPLILYCNIETVACNTGIQISIIFYCLETRCGVVSATALHITEMWNDRKLFLSYSGTIRLFLDHFSRFSYRSSIND